MPILWQCAEYLPVLKTCTCKGKSHMQAPAQHLHLQRVVQGLSLAMRPCCQFMEHSLQPWQQPGLFGSFYGTLWPSTQLDITQSQQWNLPLVTREVQSTCVSVSPIFNFFQLFFSYILDPDHRFSSFLHSQSLHFPSTLPQFPFTKGQAPGYLNQKNKWH